MKAVGTSGPQSRRSNVGAVALTVIGVCRSIRVGSRGCGIISGDPFLVVVTRCVAVGFVIDIVKIIEGTVFVVHPGVKHGDDDPFTIISTLIGAG